MRISATHFDFGSGAYEVYVAGCKGDNGEHCKGCHNPVLWDEEAGFLFEEKKDEIINRLRSDAQSIKMITSMRIYGGEPLEKPVEELMELINIARKYDLEVWMFTRFSLMEVPQEIKNSCAYIKCGKYDFTRKCEKEQYGVILASDNQHIYKKGVDY